MRQLPVYWCQQADEEDDKKAHRTLRFRFLEDWIAVDGQQAVALIEPIARDGQEIQDDEAVLKQYGGHQLTNQVMSALLEDRDLELEGTEWTITRTTTGTTIRPTSD